MSIRLISDFKEEYDRFFDPNGEDVFRRVTTDGLNRREIFEYLQLLEFNVPIYGEVKDLALILDPLDKVVLYHHLYAHDGIGKELLTIKDAFDRYPHALASQYIPFNVPNISKNVKGLSWRYLQIGTESFWIEYISPEWRSNCGENEIKVFFRDKTELFSDRQYNELLVFKYPLFAVDFIPDGDTLYAIDFNIAPKIGGTGIDKIITTREIASYITKAYMLLKDEIQ